MVAFLDVIISLEMSNWMDPDALASFYNEDLDGLL
jgi:hypothetical protein